MEKKQNSLRSWLLAARPKTLSGAAVPVMIGVAAAYADLGWVNIIPAVLCLLFAFVMQIDANLVNDFFDYVKGADDRATRLGPARACASGWVTLEAMKRAIALTTCCAVVIGLPLIAYGGWEMVAIGVLCVAFCFLYTTHLSYMGLGDILVVLFFGIVPVTTTYYILTHMVTVAVVLSAIACGIAIDALLIVNNFRDRNGDREVGKVTLVVRIGAERSLMLYLATGLVAWALTAVFLPQGHILAFILPIIYVTLHIFTYLKMKRLWSGAELNAVLGETARNIFIYGLTVSLGLVLT